MLHTLTNLDMVYDDDDDDDGDDDGVLSGLCKLHKLRQDCASCLLSLLFGPCNKLMLLTLTNLDMVYDDDNDDDGDDDDDDDDDDLVIYVSFHRICLFVWVGVLWPSQHY